VVRPNCGAVLAKVKAPASNPVSDLNSKEPAPGVTAMVGCSIEGSSPVSVMTPTRGSTNLSVDGVCPVNDKLPTVGAVAVGTTTTTGA